MKNEDLASLSMRLYHMEGQMNMSDAITVRLLADSAEFKQKSHENEKQLQLQKEQIEKHQRGRSGNLA